MPSEEPVVVDLQDGLARIQLNRPGVLNALNEDMARRLADVLRTLGQDDALRAVLIRGEGKGFCSGGDVSTFATDEASLAQLDRLIANFHEAVTLLNHLPVPTVAVLHGAVAGAGLSLALACDFAIAADTAKFTLAYSRIGATPDGGSTWALPRLVGVRKALEIACLSEVFGAEEALALGLLTRVVPATSIEQEGGAFARRLADGPTAAYGGIKQLIYRSFGATLDQQLDAERAMFRATARTADFAEGTAAFVAKRPAAFTGR